MTDARCPDCASWFWWRARDTAAPWQCWGCSPSDDGWTLVTIEIQNRHALTTAESLAPHRGYDHLCVCDSPGVAQPAARSG